MSKTIKPLAKDQPHISHRSILGGLGGRSTEGIAGSQLTWENDYLQSGSYAISLRNQLRENVKDISCLIIFYDAEENPIDVDLVRYKDVIPAGLAKRVTSKVDGSVQKLTTKIGSGTPRTKVEFRVLDFKIAN